MHVFQWMILYHASSYVSTLIIRVFPRGLGNIPIVFRINNKLMGNYFYLTVFFHQKYRERKIIEVKNLPRMYKKTGNA